MIQENEIAKQINEKYCLECGGLINSKAEICPKCGVRQAPSTSATNNRWVTTLILCWIFGVFGVHRFYTGHIVIGLVQLFTLGGCGIWTIIDLIIIISGNYKDVEGNPIVNG